MDITPFLKLMVKESASDLFFSTGAPVTMKLQGKLTPVSKQSLTTEQIKAATYTLIDEEQKQEFHDNLELNFAISIKGVGRYRANLFLQRGNMALVIRHIKTEIPRVEDLQLPSILKEIVEHKNGLILVVGATGSGKSTTLAAMIGHRNEYIGGHILTIEDPIEFVHRHKKAIVNQREVGMDTLSYENALKNAMREAPDVILIGEVRDAKTMEHALAYADTGHLCLTTLHSTNATQALDRMYNFFDDTAQAQLRDDLSRNLRAIISQRLIPDVDGKLLPAIEILLNTPFVSQIIKKNEREKLKEAMDQGVKEGMQSFEHTLFHLYKKGRIEMKTALDFADSKNDLQLKIRMDGGTLPDDIISGVQFE
ncbi:MAG: PilT/PilU family type 4a pilus ATPase [Pseudomonadota bacterium]